MRGWSEAHPPGTRRSQVWGSCSRSRRAGALPASAPPGCGQRGAAARGGSRVRLQSPAASLTVPMRGPELNLILAVQRLVTRMRVQKAILIESPRSGTSCNWIPHVNSHRFSITSVEAEDREGGRNGGSDDAIKKNIKLKKSRVLFADERRAGSGVLGCGKPAVVQRSPSRVSASSAGQSLSRHGGSGSPGLNGNGEASHSRKSNNQKGERGKKKQ